MFVQVITGRTNDAEALLAHGDRWLAEVRPGAIGYLGGTFGVAEDGTFVVLARFEDDTAAKANAERPEQDTWWGGLQPLLAGEPTVRESTDTTTLFDGPSSAAGFVQVMEGVAPDRATAEAMETPELEEQLRAARPDLLGALRVWFEGGTFVEAAYFTSEADARKGETAPGFEDAQAAFAEQFPVQRFIDLRDPRHG